MTGIKKGQPKLTLKTGRGREIRTPDILLPKQARYQTALYPVKLMRNDNQKQASFQIKLVGVERFELPTSCSQSRRATRLRYTP